MSWNWMSQYKLQRTHQPNDLATQEVFQNTCIFCSLVNNHGYNIDAYAINKYTETANQEIL